MKLVCLIISMPFFATLYGCAHLHKWAETGKVGPDYRPPKANVGCSWIDQSSPNTISIQNGVDDPCWWRVFADPHIEGLVNAANCNYLPLAIANLKILQRQRQLAIAKGNLFPQDQNSVATYQRFQLSENGNQIGVPGLGNSFDLFQRGYNASWEIDLWGKIRRQIESTDAQVGVSIEDWNDMRLSLNADVVSTYIQIRLLQQRIRIARDQVNAQQETLRIAEKRREIGTESRLDVTQALATVEATKASIPPLQAALRQSNNRICVLLGAPPQNLFTESNMGQIPVAPSLVAVGLPRDLLRRRPDVRRAERQVASQNAQIGVAVADLFPEFRLRGQLDWQAFEFRDVFDPASLGGVLAPGFTWKVLSYGRVKNNIRVQHLRLEQAVTNYRQTVLEANREAEDALIVFVKKQEELDVLRRAVQATAESIDIAEIQYKEGEIDLDRVNNLRKDLISQLDLMTAAEGQTAIALVSLFRTLGGACGLPNENCSVNCKSTLIASRIVNPNGLSQNMLNADAHTSCENQQIQTVDNTTQHGVPAPHGIPAISSVPNRSFPIVVQESTHSIVPHQNISAHATERLKTELQSGVHESRPSQPKSNADFGSIPIAPVQNFHATSVRAVANNDWSLPPSFSQERLPAVPLGFDIENHNRTTQQPPSASFVGRPAIHPNDAPAKLLTQAHPQATMPTKAAVGPAVPMRTVSARLPANPTQQRVDEEKKEVPLRAWQMLPPLFAPISHYSGPKTADTCPKESDRSTLSPGEMFPPLNSPFDR